MRYVVLQLPSHDSLAVDRTPISREKNSQPEHELGRHYYGSSVPPRGAACRLWSLGRVKLFWSQSDLNAHTRHTYQVRYSQLRMVRGTALGQGHGKPQACSENQTTIGLKSGSPGGGVPPVWAESAVFSPNSQEYLVCLQNQEG